MSGDGGGADRRTSTRVDTHQHVVFSDRRATGPLRTGTATDRSVSGLRIVTAFPESVGSTVQIELQNPSGGDVTLLEGRVMHVCPADNGQYAMGIRLVSPLLRAAAPTRIQGAVPAPRRVAARARKLDVTVGAPGDVQVTADAATAREPVTFRRVSDRGRSGSWMALAAILALLLILALLVAEAIREQRTAGPSGESHAALSVNGVPDIVPPRTGNQSNASAAGAVTPRATNSSGRALARWDAPRYAKTEPGGEVRFATVSAEASLEGQFGRGSRIDLPAMTAGRFVSLLDYAADAGERGETGLALAVVRRALRDGGEAVPAVWQQFGHALQESLAGNNSDSARLSESLLFESGQPRGDAPRGAGMRVEVDARAFVMRVWRDDALLAEFPVGLGRDGATPRGTFHVANKVTDPAWYADGRVVPAGHPENPIGGQWMGLDAGGAATGVGIHPTRQAASIGQDASRGCVRMRPADAETLYRLVPVGTAVTIHD